MTSESTTTAIPPAHRIRRLYLKGASVEVPNMARMPRTPVQPALSLDVQTGVNEAWPGALECTLRVTVQARIGDATAFLIEITEAGVFELPLGTKEAALQRFAGKTAPAILFPLARRDLAAMVTAAGFQPVVPDHVDFEEILTGVMRERGIRLAPPPVAPSAPAVVTQAVAAVTPPPNSRAEAVAEAAAQDTVPDASDTQPAFLDTQPVMPAEARPTGTQVPARRSRAPWVIAAIAAVLAIGAGWWWSQRADVADPVAKAPGAASTPPARPASVPVAPASTAASASITSPRPAVVSAATRRALDESRERLAALPAGWRSIELGHMDADADLRVLEALPLQAPLYVARLPDGQLQVLYGAYPTQEAAAAALEDTRGWKAQGLRGEPRIVVLGRAS